MVTNDIKRNTTYKHVYWQRSYYDHIIRSQKSLNTIRRYIRENPQNWQQDRNFKIIQF